MHGSFPPPPEKRLSLTLKYEEYGSKITSDRLIQLSAITIDKKIMDFQKAEKTIVLDEPDIEIRVWSWPLETTSAPAPLVQRENIWLFALLILTV